MENLFQKIDELEKLIKMQNILAKEVLDIKEASAFTGYSISTLHTYCHRGNLSYYKPRGKRVFFKKEELIAWMLRNKHMSNEELESDAENYLINNK